jgi:hypothetical protein
MAFLGRLFRWIRRVPLGSESPSVRPIPVPVEIRRIDLSTLKEGDRVVHRQFQMGTILEVTPQHVVVQFDAHGQRTLSIAHVRLYEPPEGMEQSNQSVGKEAWHGWMREQRRLEYEREFPYDNPKTNAPVERISRSSPTVSGGLPSLGKKRR